MCDVPFPPRRTGTSERERFYYEPLGTGASPTSTGARLSITNVQVKGGPQVSEATVAANVSLAFALPSCDDMQFGVDFSPVAFRVYLASSTSFFCRGLVRSALKSLSSVS